MTAEEQAAYNYLTQTHAMSKQMGMSDAEIVKIAMTAGDTPWKAICKYCDDHNEPHPNWLPAHRF